MARAWRSATSATRTSSTSRSPPARSPCRASGATPQARASSPAPRWTGSDAAAFLRLHAKLRAAALAAARRADRVARVARHADLLDERARLGLGELCHEGDLRMPREREAPIYTIRGCGRARWCRP